MLLGRRLPLWPLVAAALSVLAVTILPAAAAVAAPPSNCWVGWRPSEGSIKFANDGSHLTTMTIKLRWRAEDLTFRSCRTRAAFELETFFGTSNGRHHLASDPHFHDSTFPGSYDDSGQEANEATFGIGKADLLQADHWYSAEFSFANHLGPNEFIDVTASRGHLLSPCVGGYAICVAGWTDSAAYGPGRLAIFDNEDVRSGHTSSWSYPSRSTLHNKILRNPKTGNAYTLDGGGVRHSIHDGGTYNCLTAKGWKVVNSFADIDQQWVIDSFPQGSDATCTSPGPGDPGPGGGPGPAQPTVSLAQGPAAPQGYRYAVTLSGFSPNASVSVSCRDSVDPGGFYTFGLGTDGGGNASTAAYCYSGDGPDHWVVANGVESNHVAWGGGAPPRRAPGLLSRARRSSRDRVPGSTAVMGATSSVSSPAAVAMGRMPRHEDLLNTRKKREM